ncbi:response regulator transcription factor [Halieaceae bacterium IMCC14734]|uniref:Response regulator transcription factor n=1 Tax=Candidatus Litorirhabdus singularis TaxID=2518993 RepID=A0ABT3TIW9_9GAMM|nr:DNA-binding response regulator [Candidatus Litorirhabdus singularis]MCX2982268.1 response regulator transcription factor [Candidatus Litorirhabdus singularis]
MNIATKDSGIVLIADDSPETLGMLNEALEQSGYMVLVALEGRQALTIAEKITPDIILLDAIMPKLDGFETCRKLQTIPQLAEVPVIFMTGLNDTESIVRALDCGAVDYLQKPINPDELIARMRVHRHNASKATSARSALDSTGQHLFTINVEGRIVWATPQTIALFNIARVSDTWKDQELPSQLLQWLNHQPRPNQSIELSGLEHPLQVRYLERSDHGEVLLKLLDGAVPSGPERLRKALPLTGRESEVLYWIGNGKTNREIALILDNSPRTINKHLEQVFRKLEVSNRTSAAAIALKIMATE